MLNSGPRSTDLHGPLPLLTERSSLILGVVTSVSERNVSKPSDLVQGTLDLLILKILSTGANHGYGIALRIHQLSDDELRVEEGSLYPALYRMEEKGLIDSEWGVSENNRKAKFYKLTRKGRTAVQAEEDGWLRLSGAVSRVLRAIEQGA